MNILITGISKGLGKEIGLALKKSNCYNVMGTYNHTIPNKTDFNELFKINFNDKSEIDDFLSIIDNYNIDVLINNFHPGYKLKHSCKINPTDINSSFTNYISPTIEITNHLIKNFKKKKNGIILNILSAYTIIDAPKGLSKYTAEKKYIETFNKYWHLENSQYNIFSIGISPGIMKTSFHNSLDERFKEIMYKNNPIVDLKKVTDKIEQIISNPRKYSGKNILIN